jgi:hypothetical protein
MYWNRFEEKLIGRQEITYVQSLYNTYVYIFLKKKSSKLFNI